MTKYSGINQRAELPDEAVFGYWLQKYSSGRMKVYDELTADSAWTLFFCMMLSEVNTGGELVVSYKGCLVIYFSLLFLTVPLDRLVSESDFIVVSCSLTPDTQGLCDKAFFSKMKNTAVFINSSRSRPLRPSRQVCLCAFSRGWTRSGLCAQGGGGEPGRSVRGFDYWTDCCSWPGRHHTWTTPYKPPPAFTQKLRWVSTFKQYPNLHIVTVLTFFAASFCPRAVVLPHIGSATYSTRGIMAALAAQNLLGGLQGAEMPSELTL